jgi:pimeloyl-ACP methyl ester carboxylesterase
MTPTPAATLSRRTWLLSSAAVLAACASPSSPPPSAAARPVVLVHGAWMGASAWDRVAADLRRQGLAVTAVNLPGHGADPRPPAGLTLDQYVQAVVDALPAGGPVTLVGHSMGGMVISAVAERVPERIAHLVYVAAYLPGNAQSLYQLAMTDADSRVGAFWQQEDPKRYTPATIRADGLAEVFCADCTAADQEGLRRTHRAEPVPPMATPVTLSATRFGRVPRTVVLTLRDRAVSTALQRRMLAAAGGAATVVELDTSHLPMFTRPAEVARVIAAAAR